MAGNPNQKRGGAANKQFTSRFAVNAKRLALDANGQEFALMADGRSREQILNQAGLFDHTRIQHPEPPGVSLAPPSDDDWSDDAGDYESGDYKGSNLDDILERGDSARDAAADEAMSPRPASWPTQGADGLTDVGRRDLQDGGSAPRRWVRPHFPPAPEASGKSAADYAGQFMPPRAEPPGVDLSDQMFGR